jgi:hypothetical protein
MVYTILSVYSMLPSCISCTWELILKIIYQTINNILFLWYMPHSCIKEWSCICVPPTVTKFPVRRLRGMGYGTWIANFKFPVRRVYTSSVWLVREGDHDPWIIGTTYPEHSYGTHQFYIRKWKHFPPNKIMNLLTFSSYGLALWTE